MDGTMRPRVAIYPNSVTTASPSGSNDTILLNTLAIIFTTVLLEAGTYRLDTPFEPPDGFTLTGINREAVIFDSHVPYAGVTAAIQRNPVYGAVLTTLNGPNVRGTRVFNTHAPLAPGQVIKLNAPAGEFAGGIYTVITCVGGADPYTITVDRPIYWSLLNGSNVDAVISYPKNITIENITLTSSVDTSRLVEIVGGKNCVTNNLLLDVGNLHAGAACLSFDNFGNHNRAEHIEIVNAGNNISMGVRSEGGGEFVQIRDITMHCTGTNAGQVVFIDTNYAPTIELINGSGSVGQLVSIGIEGVTGEVTRAAYISQVRGSCVDYMIHLKSAEDTRIDACQGIDSQFGLYVDVLCSRTTLTNSSFLRGAYGIETSATSGKITISNCQFTSQSNRGINLAVGDATIDVDGVVISNVGSGGYALVANGTNYAKFTNSTLSAPSGISGVNGPIYAAAGSFIELDGCALKSNPASAEKCYRGAGILRAKNTSFIAFAGGAGVHMNAGGIFRDGGGNSISGGGAYQILDGGSFCTKGTLPLTGAVAATYSFPAITAEDTVRTHVLTLAGTPAPHQAVISPGVGVVLTGIALDTSTIAIEIAA